MKTINLLPQKRKKNLAIDNFNKFLFKIGFVAIFAIILFILFLGSNLFILNIYKKMNEIEMTRNNENEVSFIIQKTKKYIDEQYTKTDKLIKKINNKEPFLDYLGEINNLIPENVYYSKIEMDKDFIRIEGWALDRNSLIEFKNFLERVDLFYEVNMPISNLTSQKNINFEMSISLNKK